MQETGNAERRVRAQLDRVAIVAIETAQDRVNATETAERLQVHGAAAHDEILAFDEGEAEGTREERVRQVRLVVRRRREEHGEWRFAMRRRAPVERVLQGAEEGRELFDRQFTKRVGKRT